MTALERTNQLLAVAVLFGCISSTLAIKGGTAADIADHPYVVAILKPTSMVCSGALISDKHVLTVTRCINVILGKFQVRYGTSIWSDCKDKRARTKLVRRWYIHPFYDPSFKEDEYNIAVLQLESPVSALETTVRTIKIRKAKPEVGEVVTITGWGITETKTWSPNLRTTTNTVIGYADCLFNHFRNTIYERAHSNHMTCAWRDGTAGACHMDHGGPVVIGGYLVGLISWVPKYCHEDLMPDAYLRIDMSPYKDFIDWATGNRVLWYPSEEHKPIW